MRLQILLASFFCAGGVLAAVNTTLNSDGTIQSIVYRRNNLAKRACSSNNCLRAYKAQALAATSFCNTFTASVATEVAPFTQCSDAKQASSACSCFVPVSLRSRIVTGLDIRLT